MNRKMRRAAQSGSKRPSASQPAGVDPDFVSAFLKQGWVLLGEGRDEEAMEIAKRAVQFQETDESKAFFVQCVKRWSYFPGAEEMREVFARALREPWAIAGDFLTITRGVA
jgi:hypothetical protein